MDQPAGVRIAITYFEGQIPNGTAHPAILAQHPFPILVEEGEDALDGVGGLAFYRIHYCRAEIAEGKLEYLQKKLVLTFEEMVEAPGVDSRFADDGGDAGGMKALFVEELKGGAEDALLCFWGGRCGELSGHSNDVERLLNFCQGGVLWGRGRHEAWLAAGLEANIEIDKQLFKWEALDY